MHAWFLITLLTPALARPPEPRIGQVWVTGPEARGTWPLGNPDLGGAARPRILAWRAAQHVGVRRPGWVRRIPLHRLMASGDRVDSAVLQAEAEALVRWLAAQGYPEASVSWQLEPLGRRYQGVRFEVDLGEWSAGTSPGEEAGGGERDVEVDGGGRGETPGVVVHLKGGGTAHAAPQLRFGGHGWIGTAQLGVVGGYNGVAGGLGDVELSAAAGYGGTPFAVLDQSGELGPVLDAGATTRVPVWARTGLDAYGWVHGGTDLTEGARIMEASAEIGLRWRPATPLMVEVGLGPEYTRFAPSLRQREAFEEQFHDRGFVQGALLLVPRVEVTLDTRDDPLDARGGVLLRAEALPWARWEGVGRGLVEAEARAFVPVVDGLVIASRVRGGMVDPAAHDAPEQLLQRKLHLGGGHDLRGWGWGEVATDDVELGPRDLRPGGDVAVLAQLEPRIRLVPGLHASLFVDVGQVWERLDDLSARDLRVGLGGGLHVTTPIGPARLEVGWRVGDPGRLPLTIYPAIGTAF